jgi:carboxyl-terminal processing protease
MYAHRTAKLARYGLDEDALFADMQRALRAATTWAQYDAAIYNALARFHDGHLSYKPPPTAAPRRGYTAFSLGFTTVRAGMHLLVAHVDQPSTDIAAGDDVIAIDGTPVADVLADAGRSRAVSRPESAMTTFARTWTTVLYPKGDPPRKRMIRVARRDGGTVEAAIAPSEAPRVHHDAVTVGGDAAVAVVAIHSLEGGARTAALVDDAFAKARASKAIVIDLRGNRGGVDVVGHRLVADLAEGTASLGSYRVLVAAETLALRPMWKSLVATSDGFSAPQPITVQALDHGFKGKVAVIVDAACASTCEVMAAALRADLHAVVIGETTGGSSGAPVTIHLPVSRASVSIPTWDLISAEGQPIEDLGVVPDLAIDATPEALAKGQDLLLDTAIANVHP